MQVEEERDVLPESDKERFQNYVTVVLWVSIVLFVVAVVSLIRSFQIEAAVDDLNDHTITLQTQTDDARTAAIEARDTLQEALNKFEERRANAEGSSPEAVAEALKAVARIEQHLCGGPCDTNTSTQ